MQKIFIILSSNKALCVERVLTEFQRFVYLRRKEVHVNGGRAGAAIEEDEACSYRLKVAVD